MLSACFNWNWNRSNQKRIYLWVKHDNHHHHQNQQQFVIVLLHFSPHCSNKNNNYCPGDKSQPDNLVFSRFWLMVRITTEFNWMGKQRARTHVRTHTQSELTADINQIIWTPLKAAWACRNDRIMFGHRMVPL